MGFSRFPSCSLTGVDKLVPAEYWCPYGTHNRLERQKSVEQTIIEDIKSMIVDLLNLKKKKKKKKKNPFQYKNFSTITYIKVLLKFQFFNELMIETSCFNSIKLDKRVATSHNNPLVLTWKNASFIYLFFFCIVWFYFVYCMIFCSVYDNSNVPCVAIGKMNKSTTFTTALSTLFQLFHFLISYKKKLVIQN